MHILILDVNGVIRAYGPSAFLSIVSWLNDHNFGNEELPNQNIWTRKIGTQVIIANVITLERWDEKPELPL